MFRLTQSQMKRVLRLIPLIGLFLFTLSFIPVHTALAANFTPTCSTAELVSAVNTANTNGEADTITLATGCTYTLTSTLSVATDGGNALTIEGNATNISGNNTVGVINISSGATLTLNNVTISDGSAVDGGGIFNDGTLTITGSAFSGNSVTDDGAAIYNNGGTVNISDSTFSGNSAFSGGGGIFNFGTLTVSNSTFSGNSAFDGGGIFNDGTLTVSDSNFSDNTIGDDGGGIYNSGTLTMSNSVFFGNTGIDLGGGIYNDDTMTLTNSTLSGNSTSFVGGGIYNSGTLTMTNSTLSGNSASVSTGGIANIDTATIHNSIIANNTNLNCSDSADVQYSLVEEGLPCGVIDGVNGNLTGDPALNGDLTLSASSPAIDAGSDALVPVGITTDLAGNPRIQGAAVDMGAFESAPLPTPNLSITDVSLVEGNSGTTAFNFTVSLSSAAPVGGVTFDIATADGSATTADNDYLAQSLTGQTIAQGSTTYAFDVTVNGDTVVEPDETFFVNVTSVVGALVSDGQGQGTILNDDAPTATPTNTATPTLTPTPFTESPTPSATPSATNTPAASPTATHTPASSPTSSYPPPPDVPECEAHNFDEGGVVRSNLNNPAVNCRVMYQNGHPTTWFGADLYHPGHVGIQGVLDLGVQQAIDIFSPSGLTYFEGGAVFCLRGSGTLIWMAASHTPRNAEIIGSYTVPDFPGFTCATLFEPGALVLVR